VSNPSETNKSALNRYIEAATRENTRRSYQSAIQHYEIDFGGKLPANAKDIATYLAAYAPTLKATTLNARLAALSRWHVDQGFDDPTKHPVVRKAMKGIRTVHAQQPKQAWALSLDDLRVVDQWHQAQIDAIHHQGDPRLTTLLRNRALINLGFWRAFRGDELCRLEIEHITLTPGRSMSMFLNVSKGDREATGKVYDVPALQECCPVAAVGAWLEHLGADSGALFRGVDRWGNIKEARMNTNSLIPLLRQAFGDAGIASANKITSHSLKRGFANWAGQNGWDVKSLMEYVGWKDPKTAIRYLDSRASFGALALEAK